MAVITGTALADLLKGSASGDRIVGQRGKDRLFGRRGDDLLLGGDDDDLLRGDEGNDRLHGDSGADTLYGGAGDDLLLGGDQDDLLLGQDGADRLFGQRHADRLHGGHGADRLYGGDGADRLDGGTGDDLLDGGAGLDLLLTGTGDDTYVIDHAAEIDRTRLDPGYDVVRSSVSYVMGLHQEELVLLGTASIDADARVSGFDIDHVLIGNSGNNVLRSGSGTDVLKGGGGDDVLIGSRGDDLLLGGIGNDLLFHDDDTRVDGGPGTDSIVLNNARTDNLVATSIEIIDLRLATVAAHEVEGVFAQQVALPLAATLATWNADATVLLRADVGDVVVSQGERWRFDGLRDSAGVSVRAFTRGAATVLIEQGAEVAFNPSFDFDAAIADEDLRLEGLATGDRLGHGVAGIGDFNGDGFDDFALGATGAGASYLLFGGPDALAGGLPLAQLDGQRGFRLDGGGASGYSVSAAGDVNGDGLADLLIGAPDAGVAARGAAYLLFGTRTAPGASLDLTTLDGDTGLRLGVPLDGARIGEVVAGVGDLNRDGYDDLGIGMRDQTGNDVDTGSVFVMFGKPSGFAADVDLTTLNGTTGFRFDAALNQVGQSFGMALSAGDLNGDGYADLVVGTPIDNQAAAAQVFVMFGHEGPYAAQVSSAALDGSVGFTVEARTGGGFALAADGDLNSDGFDDLIIGEPRPGTGIAPGGGYRVVLGSAAPFAASVGVFDLDGTDGYVTGSVLAAYASSLGGSLDFVGDINGDGYDDFAVSSGLVRDIANEDEGRETIVLFGAADAHRALLDDGTTPPTLNNPLLGGLNGFRVEHFGAGRMRVTGAGDINGDGFDDLLFADDDAAGGAGRVFALLGRDFGFRLDVAGDAGDDVLTGTAIDEALLGAGGDDHLDGGGGSDALLGVPGNDILLWDAADFRLDGGGNDDTLRVMGADLVLDFSLASLPRITGIDVLDLTGNGDNALTFGLADVMGMSDHNRLRIDGDSGDSITSLGQGWQPSAGGNVMIDTVTYQVFDKTGVTLLIDSAVTIAIS